tara:strand:- start:232 stop:1374 length:1143 start_codon:yes stop_codon:yes gene_type:complete
MPLKKIGRAIKKTVRKIVPKEVAGIMQVAAPFVAPISLPGALALSLGGQLRSGQGKINPFATLAAIAPSQQFRDFTGAFAKNPNKLQSLGRRVDDFLYGTEGKQGLISFGGEELTPSGILKSKLLSTMKTVEGVTKPVLSPTKVGTAITMGLSLSQTQQQIQEEGEDIGLPDDQIAKLQAEAAEMWEDFDTTAFKPKVKDGGLMRTKFAMGTVNPFKPKPEDYGIEDNELPAEPKPFKPKPNVGNKAEITANSMAMDIFGMPFNELPAAQQNAILDLMGMGKPQAKKGGLMRANYALGTKPTKEESGLGGLPIEADMRYSGGFMPYGAKEKADDVPARLSKNEFVFTADAVRAAGGGSVQKGAQKMYNTMKQLESMGAMV